MEQGTGKNDDLALWNDPISQEEKLHHEILFYSQGPVDGYLSGERARDIFLHSRLPLTVLSQIWNLADVSNDNVLSREEFTLAMHLILKVKEGLPVPRRLPKHLVPSPDPVTDIDDVTDIEREAYQNVFNKLNLEFIDAIQGRQLLLESKLPVEELSQVWDLADIDRNGQLDRDEWAVSCHLVRNLKKGVKLNGSIDVFKWIPQRLSSVSYQARKHRVDEYNRKKHHLMTQKEKRKTQIDNETRRLELLKKRYHLHKELFDVSKSSSDLNIPEEEFLLYKEKEENNIEKVEAILYRLKKEHEKIRQETVKVILGEQGSLQEDARLAKLEQDDVKHRLLTIHTKATKDPDPFHELYELRKELRKRSTLSEGEEPEVHFPFVASPFDKESIQPKFSGHSIFVHPSPSVLNNNNSNHKKAEVLADLCEFGDRFIERWTSGKDNIVVLGDSSQDTIFMTLNVPIDGRVWSGIKWGENMDSSSIQSLHIRLVDLKEEMEKLNEDTGGQLLFRNPDDYLARKKAQEEEEKLEKSKYQRRGQSDKRAAKGDKEFKRRSYAAPQRDEDSQKALSEYRQKRRSLNLDKRAEKSGDASSVPDIPQRSNRRSNIDKKNKEKELSVNTKEGDSFSPASASSPRSVESPVANQAEIASPSPTSPLKPGATTSPSRPSTKRRAAPPPPQSPPKTPNANKDKVDSPIKQQPKSVNEPTSESKIPKFVGVTENTDNTHPNRPPRRKKKEGNKSFLHDSFEKENQKESSKEEVQLKSTVNEVNQSNSSSTLPNTVEVAVDNPVDNLNGEKEDSFLDSVIKELPSLKSSGEVEENIVNVTVKSDLESEPVKHAKEEIIIAKTDDGVELAITPEKISREKGKFRVEDTQTKIELKEKYPVISKPVPIDSDDEQEVVKVANNKTIEVEVDEPDGYLDHIKPVAFRKQAPAEDLDQAFEKIAFLADIKKSKDSKDTLSIASDISSTGSEPPPLPDSAPPPFSELLTKTPSLTEVSEIMEVAESIEIEKAPLALSTEKTDVSLNGEISPVMSPISDLKSISMRVTSPTRDRGGDVQTNGALTIDVGNEKKTLDYDSDMSEEEGQPDVVGSFTPDSQIEPTVASPDDSVLEWRSEVSKHANIDWEEKPDKVDLYSQNVIQENGNTESVDRESIANLSTTRKQWENILKTSDTQSPSPQKTKDPVKQVRHWEVKLPTKSKVVPADVIKSRVDTDSDSENETKMDDSENINESAIEREIRLAMEREELLRKEKEERSQPEAGQNVSSKSAFESVEENNNKPTYHEMTEADRGSELQQREELIQKELQEQMEREVAIRGDKPPEDDSSSQSSQEDENANESIIEREIRLQEERERELELSRKHRNMSKSPEPAPKAEMVEEPTVVEEEVVVEETTVVEEMTVVESSIPDRSSPTPVSTPAGSTPDNLSETDDHPPEIRSRISYEQAISSATHQGESLIARELREAREREEELAQQRKRMSGTITKNNTQQQSPVTKQTLNNVSNELSKTKIESVSKPSYQNDVSPYKSDRKQSQDSLSSHSTEKSQPNNITPRSKNVRITSFGDKFYNRTPERKDSPQKDRGETPIEREMRLARERENEFRAAKGLPLLEEPKKEEEVIEEKPQDDVVFQQNRSAFYGQKSSNSSIQKFASSRLQKEIDKQTALEKKYREEGKIKSTSEDHVGLVKYTEITKDKNTPTKRNFVVPKKATFVEPKVEQNGTEEAKPPTPKPQTPEQTQSKFGRSISGGSVTFSYRESRHKAESKIEQELREMREREEELRSQRAGAGIVSPTNPDSPRSSNSVGNKRSQFEQST